MESIDPFDGAKPRSLGRGEIRDTSHISQGGKQWHLKEKEVE